MKIFVTGSSGLIGSNLLVEHLNRGDAIHGCDIAHPATSLQADVRDFDALAKTLMKYSPDRVYHCAAMLGVANTERWPLVCRNINEDGTKSALAAAKMANVKEFVFFSSSEVYGNPEPGQDAFKETDPLNGKNVYAEGKALMENYVLANAGNMRVIIVRMFNTYGLRQVKQFFIPKAVGLAAKDATIPLYGSPSNYRSYLYATDAATMVAGIADNSKDDIICNVGNFGATTLYGAASFIVEKMQSKSQIKVFPNDYEDRDKRRDVPIRVADLTKMKTLTKHMPMPFEKGVMRVIVHHTLLKDDWTYERTVI
jgi:nucleoside-diphosphate-sugar epimerase